MKHFISHWELQSDTQNTWASVNCTNGRAEIIKNMGCWMLEIRFNTGKSHVSSHNTRDEAMRQAETQAAWNVEFV